MNNVAVMERTATTRQVIDHLKANTARQPKHEPEILRGRTQIKGGQRSLKSMIATALENCVC